jgi:hypothetical protein
MLLVLALAIVPVYPVDASEARELDWSDLIPEALTEAGREASRKQARLTRLPDDQRQLDASIAEEMS